MSNLKKIIVDLFILLVLFSSQAFAFQAGDLVLTVYNQTTGSTELGIDLGSWSSLSQDLTSATPITLASAGSINLTTLGASFWSDLNAGIFSFSSTNPSLSYDIMGTTDNTTAPNIKTGGVTGFGNNGNTITGWYQSQSGGASNTGALDATNHSSYYYIMETHGTVIGAMGGYNKDATSALNLANLDSGQVATMYLYGFLANNVQSGAGSNPYLAAIDFLSNGSVVLEANATQATPIPAGFMLFGSGLLGLFGLKRTKEAA